MKLANVIIGVGVVGAAYVAVTQPVGRPSATRFHASHHAAFGVDGPSGFNRAHGSGR